MKPLSFLLFLTLACGEGRAQEPSKAPLKISTIGKLVKPPEVAIYKTEHYRILMSDSLGNVAYLKNDSAWVIIDTARFLIATLRHLEWLAEDSERKQREWERQKRTTK